MTLNYMPIMPLGMLDLFAQAQVKHGFILPAFWHHAAYRNMYMAHDWDVVIIDNDVYEQPETHGAPIEKLIEIAESLHSGQTFIVAKESLTSVKENLELAQATIKAYGEFDSERWTMMVVLHGTPEEIMFQYLNLKEHEAIGFGLAVKCARAGWDRGAIVRYIGFEKDRYLHAMGFDNLLEGLNMAAVGINSTDSSMAATAAINNIDLSDALAIVRTGAPTDAKRVDLKGRNFSKRVRGDTLDNIKFIQQFLGD